MRLLQGLDADDAPPVIQEETQGGPSGEREGRYQAAYPGSYAVVSSWKKQPLLEEANGVELSFVASPWMLDAPYFQAMVSTLDISSRSGFLVGLGTDNALEVWVGTGQTVEMHKVQFNPRQAKWLVLIITITGKSVQAVVEHVVQGLEQAPEPVRFESSLKQDAVLDSPSVLYFAATEAASPTTRAPRPTHFFNGRLEKPTIKALGQRSWIVAQYDFSVNISSDIVHDVSGSGLHGDLVNHPTRAIRGHDWDERSIGTDWTTAKYGYGAVHFHEDDLDDAAWETDFKFTVPSNARSGVYGIKIEDTASNLQEIIPFFVRPKGRRPQAKTAFVFSTFTYLAYANEHMYDESKPTRISFPEGIQLLASKNYERMLRRTDLGLAIYDLHSDGSGVVYSSAKRPILNMRPDYVHWGFQRPREFSADLLMVGFLERLFGDGYDVLTDHDLHLRGASALTGYDCVIAGSHPEYPSLESFNAYEDFAKRGGNIVYTGGNGFYVRLLILRRSA